MNKGLLTILMGALSLRSFFSATEQYYHNDGGRPTPNRGNFQRRQPAPNDGRWHMKYHRSRR